MDYGASDYSDKNAITALLKGIDPGTDVFYEEIKGTEEKYGLNEPETYYFVDIIPNGNQTVDRFFTDMGVLVDIAYHEKNESNTAYLIKGAEIDAVVRPVFSFGDQAYNHQRCQYDSIRSCACITVSP
ncbi:MAG: hypothetical protein ACLVCH_04140 [Roseburia inulinivorans]